MSRTRSATPSPSSTSPVTPTPSSRTMPVGGLAHRRKIAGPLGHRLRSRDQQRAESAARPATVCRRSQRRRDPEQRPAARLPAGDDRRDAGRRPSTIIGSELNVFDTATNQFVFRYVDVGRDQSMLVTPGADRRPRRSSRPARRSSSGSGPEQMCGARRFSCSSRSCIPTRSKCSAINQNPAALVGHPHRTSASSSPAASRRRASRCRRTARPSYVANMQTEDVSFLVASGPDGRARRGRDIVTVGVTD